MQPVIWPAQSDVALLRKFLSTVDRVSENNSVLVQFTLPAVGSLILWGLTFAERKLTSFFCLTRPIAWTSWGR